MKAFFTLLAGMVLGVLFTAAFFAGQTNREYGTGFRNGVQSVRREAVANGNGEWAHPNADPRGFKWHIRQHESQRDLYPNEVFVANNR